MTWENWCDPSGYSGSIRFLAVMRFPLRSHLSGRQGKTIIKGFNEVGSRKS
jgi:hypothetical protein